jgi:hypothetical protein
MSNTAREYYIVNRSEMGHHIARMKNILDTMRIIEYSKGINVVWTKSITDIEDIIKMIKSKSIVQGESK